jgi:hypothetical protein
MLIPELTQAALRLDCDVNYKTAGEAQMWQLIGSFNRGMPTPGMYFARLAGRAYLI